MTAVVEHIKNEIHSLSPDEARELFQELRRDFPLIESEPTEDQASVEAAWDAEMDTRVQEIEEGGVQLLTAEESEKRTNTVFARLGIQRPVYKA